MLLAAWVPDAAAQRLSAGVQFVSVSQMPFGEADRGVGGRLSLRLGSWVGLETEATLFPAAYPETAAFSARRFEFLAGATLGPTLGVLRPFVRLRSGFVDIASAPAPLACIAIYPPPLACVLAQGARPLAYDLGTGAEVFVGRRGVLRVDIGARRVRYPGPSLAEGEAHEEPFFSRELRLAVGAGVRF